MKPINPISLHLNMTGKESSWIILAVNAFNSDRKRMSILLQEKTTKEYVLMCKGADSTMINLCAMSSTERQSIEKSLLDLSCEGLRTLCISQRKLSESEALIWLESFKIASTSFQNRSEQLAEVGCFPCDDSCICLVVCSVVLYTYASFNLLLLDR